MVKTATSKLYLLLLVIIIVWGLSWPVSKIAFQYMPPLWFVVARLAIGTLSVFLLVGALRKLTLPKRKDLPIIFTIGLLQIGLFMTLVTLGLQYVDAGRSAILVYTTPLWVLPLAIAFFHETASPLKWLGFVLGVTGIIILFSPTSVNWSDHQVLFGNGMLLAAALCWAIAILCARNMHWTRTPLELLPWQLLVGTIPACIFTYFIQPHPIIHWNNQLLISLGYIGVLATGFAYWGTLTLSKELPSITISLAFLGVPVTGVLLAAWMLHESITISILAAMLFIIGGLGCVILGSTKKSLKLDSSILE